MYKKNNNYEKKILFYSFRVSLLFLMTLLDHYTNVPFSEFEDYLSII